MQAARKEAEKHAAKLEELEAAVAQATSVRQQLTARVQAAESAEARVSELEALVEASAGELQAVQTEAEAQKRAAELAEADLKVHALQ